jgi:hypothetical protein
MSTHEVAGRLVRPRRLRSMFTPGRLVLVSVVALESAWLAAIAFVAYLVVR